MGNFLRRAGWALLALLFIVTGLGVGVYAFWVNVHHSNNSSNSTQSTKNQLAGKPLAGFQPTADITKLKLIDQKLGQGTVAKADSTVTVDYTGAVAASGIVFQSSL